MTDAASGFVPTDAPEAGTFEAIYGALDASSRPVFGPAAPRLLVIPIRDDGGVVPWRTFAAVIIGLSFHEVKAVTVRGKATAER